VQFPNMNNVTQEWFAVQVRTGREHVAAHHMRSRGYHVFLPCYTERRRWSDRFKDVECALFAGYVLCLIDGEVVAKLITSPGVIRVVSDGQRPAAIPHEEIEAIRRLVETGMKVEPWQGLQAGQRVRIDRGPLRGIDGVVLSVKGRHRLIVSISVLKRSVAVELDPDCVSIPSLAAVAALVAH
jgi:transcription antitermination factor NusG